MDIAISDPSTMFVFGGLFFIFIGLLRGYNNFKFVGVFLCLCGVVLYLYSSGLLPPIISKDIDISVSSSPVGADIYLDGTNKGKTPMSLNDIKQGPHNITLKLAEYEDWSQTVNLNASTGSISPTLTPILTEGNISISSSPDETKVYIDGTYKGETPTILTNIEQGSHKITVKLEGYGDWSQTIIVEAGKTTSISPILEPTRGNISVSSSPDEAKVYIDGTYKGETPTILNNIEKGFHEITLKLEGYEDWTQHITVDIGKTTPVLADLTKTTPPPPEIQITYPLNTAKIKENATGNAKNIPEGQQLWIAIYPHTASKYYPQNPVSIKSDGSWDLPVQFGGAENAGEEFDIVAFLADDNAQKELIKYIKESEEAKFFDGIRILPDKNKIITKLTVIRV